MLKITHTEENNRKFFSKKVLHLLNVKLNILFRCGPSPEPCPAVPVLPDPDPHCHVSSEQQQSVLRIRQEPTARVPPERLGGVPVHRRPHAVPLHKG